LFTVFTANLLSGHKGACDMKYVKKILLPRNPILRGWRNVIVFILLVVLVFNGVRFYLDSFEIYDFSHLTPVNDFGAEWEFTPIEGEPVVPGGFVRGAENDYLALYVHPGNAIIAVYDKRNSFIWYSSPPGRRQDNIASGFEVNVMQSVVGMSFFDRLDRNLFRWSYADSVAHQQAEIFSMENGITIRYLIGNKELGIHALPRYIETERFQYRILDQVYATSDRNWLARNFNETPARPGFMRMSSTVRTGVHAQRIIAIFEEIGYTLEELELDNMMAGVESEQTLDLFTVYVQFILDGDSLILNAPLHRIDISNEINRLNTLEFMRLFGAGSDECEGFILIPSGSGAIIEFNNQKSHEERFSSPMYGFDLINNFQRPQVLQPVRLPVFGINHGNAAMVAHIESGAALASVTADVAGRLNSFNYAWFSFNLRDSQRVPIGLPGTHRVNTMTMVQNYAFEGDITIRYHFISNGGDEVNIAQMAAAYRNFLVDNGTLTPHTAVDDRAFYLDIIGSVDVREFFVGVPYRTEQIMTTFADAHHMLDILNSGDVNNVQMQWHGWFNRGVNHHVANRVNRTRGLGSLGEMQGLNTRLQNNGGALNPVVNFTITSYISRRFNTNFEVARDVAGWRGSFTPTSREVLNTRWSHYYPMDRFYLVHPGVIPTHVARFINAYQPMGIGNLTLGDMGDVITESVYRRNSVDREHSRLIAHEQMGLLQENFPHLVVFGGNDYALRYAAHLVDVPTTADWFYIIDAEVPFFQMVMHGYLEFAGAAVNLQAIPDVQAAFLTSMATGAGPRFTFTAEPTRLFRFSPHERMTSTYYMNWMQTAIDYYNAFNAVHRYLINQPIVYFNVLAGTVRNHVTVTEFANGTRIYVNGTEIPFDAAGITIPAFDFIVTY